MENKFAVFILTHGRADRIVTYNTLRGRGYTGDIWIIVDNEDASIEQYRQKYGEQVVAFDKLAAVRATDAGDNFADRRAVVYARNACFQIARDLGVEYFLELDDDYTEFLFKFTSNLVYCERRIHNLDAVFAAMLEFYMSIPAAAVAFLQNGDFIGGSASSFGGGSMLARKAMNTFFCSQEREFKFFGKINEDVNAYTALGNRGVLFFSTNLVSIAQKRTQSNKGGLTDIYLAQGTYVKSFYTVMYAPSCAKVATLNSKHARIHHEIRWKNAVPKILREEHRGR